MYVLYSVYNLFAMGIDYPIDWLVFVVAVVVIQNESDMRATKLYRFYKTETNFPFSLPLKFFGTFYTIQNNSMCLPLYVNSAFSLLFRCHHQDLRDPNH